MSTFLLASAFHRQLMVSTLVWELVIKRPEGLITGLLQIKFSFKQKVWQVAYLRSWWELDEKIPLTPDTTLISIVNTKLPPAAG